MASTYENDLRLEEMATGENSGSWGTKTNTNLELIADAFSYGTETIANADTTITIADGAADAARSLALKINSSADLTTTRTITLAPNTTSKVWIIENNTSGGQTLTISAGSGSNVTLLNGQTKIIATDGIGAGSNVVELTQDLAIADLFIDDDLSMQSDGAIINFGADADITLTHAADTSLTLGGAGSTTGLIVNNTATDGDPFLAFALSGTQKFTMGVDDGDSDKFKIGTTAIGTDTRLSIDSSGNVEIAGDISLTGATTISNTSGDLTVDVAGDINLDSGGSDILLKVAGTPFASFRENSGNFRIKSEQSDKDMLFMGNDGGSEITALTLDMSEAGAATFNSDVTTGGKLTVSDAGNATVAAIRFNAGLGLSSPSTDQLNFITADTTRMLITSAGVVDIGSTGGAGSGNVILSMAGGVGTQNGTAAAPTHTFYSDPDTGMYRTGANALGFSTGGSERMRIQSDGFVGIGGGGTQAYYPLHVYNNSDGIITRWRKQGATNNPLFEIELTEADSSTILRTSGSNVGPMIFERGSSEAMRIETNQRVLLGHTSSIPVEGNQQKLQLVSSDADGGITIARFNNNFGPYLSFGRSGSGTIGNYTAVPVDDELGRIQWGVADGTDMASVGASISAFTEELAASNDVPSRIVFSTTANNASTPTERMRITKDGGVIFQGPANAGSAVIASGTLGSTNTFAELAGSGGSGTMVLSRGTTSNDAEIGSVRFVNRTNSSDSGLGSTGRAIAAISVRSVTSDSNAGGDSGSTMKFFTKPEAGSFTERLTIASGGNVTVQTGNLIIGTSGQGIDFSATGDGSGSMSNELLDDYEEGTFTPTLTSGYTSPTYSIQMGRYTKIGNIVRAYFRVKMTGGTANATNVIIGGLPYTALTDGSQYPVGTGYINLSSAYADVFMGLQFQQSSEVRLYRRTTTANATLTGNDLGNALDILYQVIYMST